MLDWRGLIGTSLIHGAAIVGCPALDLTTTLCLCRVPSPDEPMEVSVSNVRRVSVFPIAAQLDGVVNPVPRHAETCGGPAELTPIMIATPEVPPQLSSKGPIAFCASVDPTGRVTALRLLRAGDHSRRSVAAVRRLLHEARFQPVLRDRHAISARVEIALTT